MKLTKSEMNVAMDYILRKVHEHNYGMWKPYHSTLHVSMRDEVDFHNAGWKVEMDKGVITLNGSPMYRIRRKYASRKVDGMYKELKPTLVYIEE